MINEDTKEKGEVGSLVLLNDSSNVDIAKINLHSSQATSKEEDLSS